MEFNQLVKADLFPMLQEYGFGIAEEFKNIIRFQSSVIEMDIVYNDFEKSCYISIGKKKEPLDELRNNAVKELFNSSLSVEQVTPEIFIQNLSAIFKTKEGVSILKGNVEDFIKYNISEANDYTFELLQRQTLEIASKAWARNEYKEFVKNVDEIGKDDPEMLEDLVAAAVNDAVNKVGEMSSSRMAKVTGGMNLPPGFKLPF